MPRTEHPLPLAPLACRCSPLGAASAQCHENGTCVCRPGFEGYKCDRCHDNFFLTADGTHCQECPSCYALVKEEVSLPKPTQLSIHSISLASASSMLGTRNCLLTPRAQALQTHHPPSPYAHPASGLFQPGSTLTSALPLLWVDGGKVTLVTCLS